MNLTTDRLLIRNFDFPDVEGLYRLLEDPRVMEYSVIGPITGEKAAHYIQSEVFPNSTNRPCGIWASELRETGEFLGLVGLNFQEVDGKSFLEVGFRLLPDYWGKGYATEAAKGLLSYAWKHHQVDRVICIIDEANTRSEAVASRLDMALGWSTTYEGCKVNIYQVFRPALEA